MRGGASKLAAGRRQGPSGALSVLTREIATGGHSAVRESNLWACGDARGEQHTAPALGHSSVVTLSPGVAT